MESQPVDILLVQGFTETPEGLVLLAGGKQLHRIAGQWLAVVADLGAQADMPGAAWAPSVFANDLRRRVMKSRFPVVDLIGADGGPVLRLAALAVPWLGYRGAGWSSPLNLLACLERLSTQAALSVDLGFTGLGPIVDPAGPLPEGAELQRARIFDGYVRGWAGRFRAGERPLAVAAVAPAIAPPNPEAVLATLGLDAGSAPAPFRAQLSRLSMTLVVLGLMVVVASLLVHRASALTGWLIPALCFGVVARELQRGATRWTGYRAAPLARLTSGRVRVTGTVGGPLELRTPLTELPCAVVRWQVEAVEGRQRRTLERGDRRLPFQLGEGATQVRVSAGEAELAIEPLRSGREQVTTEWALVAGAPVVVWGVARRLAAPASGFEIVAHLVADARSAERIERLPKVHAGVLMGAWVFGIGAVIGLLAAMFHR